MGTRGLLLIRWKGNYYVIWNNNDSYPSCMGASILLQIWELANKFDGDVRLAGDHWGGLLTQLTFVQGDDGNPPHPFNKAHTFESIQKSLEDHSEAVCLCQPISPDFQVNIDCFIEFIWEINLDVLSFGLVYSNLSKYCITWSFKNIYFLLNRKPEKAGFERMWQEECESMWDNRRKQSFKTTYHVILIQRQVRRFLALKKALEPGRGIFFLQSKQRFEEKQAALAGLPVSGSV